MKSLNRLRFPVFPRAAANPAGSDPGDLCFVAARNAVLAVLWFPQLRGGARLARRGAGEDPPNRFDSPDMLPMMAVQ